MKPKTIERKLAQLRIGGKLVPPGSGGLAAFLAHYAATRELALFKKTKNGAHWWRAYVAYRAISPASPIPQRFLESAISRSYLDSVAAAVLVTTDANKLKRAMGLVGRKGGPTGFVLARGQSRERDIVEFVWKRLHGGPAPKRGDKTRIYREAAQHFGRKQKQIEQICSRWGVQRGLAQTGIFELPDDVLRGRIMELLPAEKRRRAG